MASAVGQGFRHCTVPSGALQRCHPHWWSSGVYSTLFEVGHTSPAKFAQVPTPKVPLCVLGACLSASLKPRPQGQVSLRMLSETTNQNSLTQGPGPFPRPIKILKGHHMALGQAQGQWAQTRVSSLWVLAPIRSTVFLDLLLDSLPT